MCHRRALPERIPPHKRRRIRARTWLWDESQQQLALLQAQIEPHFLFNVLGSVRRLYHTRPQAGSEAIASLMRYLRAALPQLRSQSGCLGDEFELARAYLDLCKVRMGARLSVSLEADPALLAAEFPPMLLITLVENAIKHGVEPAARGHVSVSARRRRRMLEVSVLDDGAGFGAAGSDGTGVGLANVQRQLAARYRGKAQLILEAREPRGAIATICIPLQTTTAFSPDRRRSDRRLKPHGSDVPSTVASYQTDADRRRFHPLATYASRRSHDGGAALLVRASDIVLPVRGA